jgi:hypothetical protein
MTRRARQLALVLYALLALALATLSTPARAQEHQDKREVPDYDGREEETTAGDVLIWIPRVALSPLYLVSEYVVRRPIGFLVTEAERSKVPELLYNLFTWGPNHEIGLIPIAFVDFGFDPSVGLYFFWDDAFIEHHDLRFHASTWGIDWLAARLTDRFHLVGVSPDTKLIFDAAAINRPDYAFYGIGPRTREANLSRYSALTQDVTLTLDHGFWRASRFTSAFGLRSVTFHEGDYDDDPTVESQVINEVFPEPDGFDDGYTLLFSRATIAIDSRRPRPASGSGFRLEAHAQHSADLRDDSATGFMRYGGSAGGFLDLNDHGRVVSLSVTTLFVDPLGTSTVPFTELASVGGEMSMRGFVPGRLYDRSAAFSTLRYRWPIWFLLDGSIQLAVGNVFGEHLRDLRPGLLRFSGAIGIESVGSPDSSLELLFGVGSETFDDGGEITSMRLVVGTNHGF